MTREEEIKKQAEKKALEPSRLMHPYAKQYKVMSAYEIGYIEGAVWADSHPHWISVDDELPKGDEFYLCVVGGDIEVLFYNEGLEEFYEFYVTKEEHLSCDDLTKRVTHWMPLPQAPKKGGDQ